MAGGSRCPDRYRVLVRRRAQSKDGENHLALAADGGSDRLRSKSLGDVSASSFTSRLPRVRQSSRVLSESASSSSSNIVAMLSRSSRVEPDIRSAALPKNAKPPSHAVRLRLQRVDFQTISAIDQVAQTFAARIFVIFDIPADAVTDTLLAGLNEQKGPFRSARHSK